MQKAGPGHLWVWHPAVRGKHSPRSSSVRCQVREDLLNLRAAQLSSSASSTQRSVPEAARPAEPGKLHFLGLSTSGRLHDFPHTPRMRR